MGGAWLYALSNTGVLMMTTDVAHQHWLETHKSLITLSIEGFKFSALASEGAAVTVLAYPGNVAGTKCIAHPPDMQIPMMR
jgi:hypothetical protein